MATEQVFDNIDAVELGRRLTLIRVEHGLSQQSVANAVGVARLMIENLESGARPPGAALLYKLSQLYGCPVGEFVRADNLRLSANASGLPERAINAYERGMISEGRLAHLLQTDRVGARDRIQHARDVDVAKG